MKIFYWGDELNGYRQKGFQDYANNNNYIIYYSKKYLNSNNKYILFFCNMINDLLNSINLFCSSIVYIPPMEHTILKIILTKLYQKKTICDIYAPLYDMTVNDEKIYNKRSIMGKLYYYRDRVAMLHSTVVLFLNEAEKEHFCSTVNISPNKTNSKIVPLIIDKKPFAKINFFSKRNSSLNICWTGSFVALQGFDIILETIKILKQRNFNFVFNIISPKNNKCKIYNQMIIDYELTDYVHFIDVWGNMEKWEDFIYENCDISLGVFGNSNKAKCVVANKVIDGIAFKTPVITGYSKGLDYYFNQETDIFTVKNDAICIADKIIEVSSKDTTVIKSYLDNAYKIYIENFSRETYMKNMDKVFKELNLF